MSSLDKKNIIIAGRTTFSKLNIHIIAPMNCSFVFPVCLADLGPGDRMRPGAGFTAQQLLLSLGEARCQLRILPATTCHLNTGEWQQPQYMKRREQENGLNAYLVPSFGLHPP